MASVEREVFLQVPDIGSADKIELVKWYKREGDSFEEEEEICEISTDKAVFSIEAPHGGIVKEILVKEKEEVQVGQFLAKVVFFLDEE